MFAISRLTCKAILGNLVHECFNNSTPIPERTFESWLAAHGVNPSADVLGACYPDALQQLYSRGAVPCVLIHKPKLRGCDTAVHNLIFGSSEVFEVNPGLSDNMFTDSLSVEDLQEMASRSADNMRKWAPAILDNYPEDRDELGSTLQFLDRSSSNLLWERGPNRTHCGWSAVYDTVFLIRCLVFATHLRHTTLLKDALKRSCFVLMPQPVAHHCVSSIIEGDFEVPDKSTMSRFRLSFDCGWMIVMRMLNSASRTQGPPAPAGWRTVLSCCPAMCGGPSCQLLHD